MFRRLKVRPLPERERRAALTQFLEAIDRDPELTHFRRYIPNGPQRQLALFAAWERDAIKGGPAVCPPAVDDLADQLLCDLLELCERDPHLKNHGGAFGADRHLANLQALGAWSGQPQALDLFTRAFSHLNADAGESYPAPAANSSPAAQELQHFGEIIGEQIAENPGDVSIGGELIHHEAQTPGELSAALPRAVRRGRPPALDERAKGKLLGLMAHGLSFRQAAAQLGVHHVTLLNALKRDEAFAQQVAEARLDAISQPLLVVVEAARKNWRAAAWLAKFLNDRRISSYEQTPEERELERKRA